MAAKNSVQIEKVIMGGGAPIVVQSMTNTPTDNIEKTLAQIEELAQGGAELVRIAIPNRATLKKVPLLMENSTVPLIGDIHFDYRIAVAALELKMPKIRINPGNIGGIAALKEVAAVAKKNNSVLRIGVNSGSLPQEICERYGSDSVQALVESVLIYLEVLEQEKFKNIVISCKSSSPLKTIAANQILAAKTSYPLHLGLTEAGPLQSGLIRSAAALSPLLLAGIGDTVRISLSANPLLEVKATYTLLGALQLRQRGLEIISCPTCGRCKVDVEGIANRVQAKTTHILKPLKVAIMGCAVNGPGEAKEADIGIAGGEGTGVLFIKGKIVQRFDQKELEEKLLIAITELASEELAD